MTAVKPSSIQPASAQPSLIETMRVEVDGRILLLDRHMGRLRLSCAALERPFHGDAIREQVLTAAGLARTPGPQRVRLLVDAQGQATVQATPLPDLPPLPGARLWPARLDSREPLLRYKTTRRHWYDAPTAWLAEHPAFFDVLLSNEKGELCEGSRSNVYLQLGGKWFTPPIDCGCLPGVQRAELLERGLVEERLLYEDDFPRARGIRLSNALRGWFDVDWVRTPQAED